MHKLEYMFVLKIRHETSLSENFIQLWNIIQ